MNTDLKGLSSKILSSSFVSFSCLFITGLFFITGAGMAAAHRELWYDEFFTFYIAQLPSSGEILAALLGMVDNNPPLDYYLRHFSMKWWGETALFFRLPSAVLFLLGSFFLYRFVRFRIPSFPSVAAFCFPGLTLALYYSHEGRAYMLLYATSALSLYFWQRSVDNRHSVINPVLLYFSLTAACYSHLYGTFGYLPVALGEIVRLWRIRKIEYRIIFTIIISCLSLFFLYPFIVNASRFSTYFWSQIDIFTPVRCYKDMFPYLAYPFTAGMITVVPLACYYIQKRSIKAVDAEAVIPIHELAAAVTLCLIPVFQFIAAFTITKAFHPRYAIITVNGFSVLVAYACYRLGRSNAVLGMIITACILFSSLFQVARMAHDYSEPSNRRDAALISFIEDVDIPVVFSDAFAFLYYDHYLPDEIRKQVYYLVDVNESIHYLGHDTNDLALAKLQDIRFLNVPSYENFLKNHSEYYVVTKNFRDGWLIQKIREMDRRNELQIDLAYVSGGLKAVKILH